MKHFYPKTIFIASLSSLLIIPAACTQFSEATDRAANSLLVSQTVSKQSTKAINIAEKVDRIAEQITVRIDSKKSGNGSGVIIGKQGQTYYVVTAAHVVENSDQYEIVAPDGEKYPLKSENILTSEGLDATLIKFNSPKTYQLATIGRYDIPFEKKQWVFLSGFPGFLNGTRKLTSGFRFNRDDGLNKIIDNYILDLSSAGYELIYTNLTEAGMSGGPLLDAAGQVIGINAGVEGEYFTEKDVIQIGYAFGVPASNFLGLSTNKGIPSKILTISTTAPKELTQAEVVTLETHPSFATDKPPSNATAIDWLTYGNQLWRLQQFDEAILAIQQAIKLKPKLYQAYYALGLVYSSDGKHQLAVEEYDRVINLKPNYYQAWRDRSLALFDLEKYQEALTAIEKAISFLEDNFHLHYRRANVLFSLGRLEEAKQAYTKSIEINPNFVPAYYNSANLYYHQNQWELALANFHKAIEINPHVAEAYNNRGAVYKNQNKWELAISDFTQAIQINPNYADAYNNRGTVYDSQKKWQLALADFNKAIQINPNLALAYNNRGVTYERQKKWQLALADYNKAIQINPSNALAYYNRGGLYDLQGKWELALADFSKAIQINPSDADSYNRRGTIYKNQNKRQLALADFNKAIQINPNFARAYFNRGQVWIGLGDKQKALNDLRTAAELFKKQGNMFTYQIIMRTIAQIQ